MILAREQIVFCRIKAKCFWPAQIKQMKRGSGYDVVFINRDDLEIQNKNESDIILYEDGLAKIKGSKQSGIEEALLKAKSMIEDQTTQKKAQKKSQTNKAIQNQLQNQQQQQQSTPANKDAETKNAPPSHLIKRKNTTLSSSSSNANTTPTTTSNQISSTSSIEDSSHLEIQPSKKIQTSKAKAVENASIKKGSTKNVKTTNNNIENNISVNTTAQNPLNEGQSSSSQDGNIIQPIISDSSLPLIKNDLPTKKNTHITKKNEKIIQKQEQKIQKAEIQNVVEVKKPVGRPASNPGQNVLKTQNASVSSQKVQGTLKKNEPGKKEIEKIENGKDVAKQNSKSINEKVSETKEVVGAKKVGRPRLSEKKPTQNVVMEEQKPSDNIDNNEKPSQQDEEINKNSSQKSIEIISPPLQTAQAGNKRYQKKENLKIPPTSSQPAISVNNEKTKKIEKPETKTPKTNNKNTKTTPATTTTATTTGKGKANVKHEEVSPKKKTMSQQQQRAQSKRNSNSGKKKSPNQNNDEIQEEEQQQNNEQINNTNQNGYSTQNNNNNNLQYSDNCNDDDNDNFFKSNNIFTTAINTLTQMNPHLQESPEFGQKQQQQLQLQQQLSDPLINNTNNLFVDELSKGLLQNIANNSLFSNLLNPSQSNSNNHLNINNNYDALNMNGTFCNNIFAGNENKENNTFSLNNSPFGKNDRRYFDEQDELNLAAAGCYSSLDNNNNLNKQTLTLNQQQQILLHALKSGGVTPSQYEFYSQKLIAQNNNNNINNNINNTNNNVQSSFNLFDNSNKQMTTHTNLKFNNIFTQNNSLTENNTNLRNENVLGNITNTYNNNNHNQGLHPLMKQTKQEFSGLSFTAGGPNLDQQQIPSLLIKSQSSSSSSNSSIIGGSQLFGLNNSNDFLSQNELNNHSLSNNSNLYGSEIQLSSQVPQFGGNNSMNNSNGNRHSIIIPSPKFVGVNNNQNNSNNLQISNNSSFKVSPKSKSMIPQRCEIQYQMKNKILPMLEAKMKNKIYYENEKDMWLCEIVDCVRSLKTISIEQIYGGDYTMLLEQIYDALLTIQELTKRNFSYVLNMIQRTMNDLDKKIIKHLHDYSRVRGEKYHLTREDEIQKKQSKQQQLAIKIEDKDDSIEITSSLSYHSQQQQLQQQYHKKQQQMNYFNQVKTDPSLNLSSPPRHNLCKESESTAKKQNFRSKKENNENIINGYYNSMNNNMNMNNNINNNIHNNSMNNNNNKMNLNQSLNNDLFNQSISETLREINNQPEQNNDIINKNNQSFDLQVATTVEQKQQQQSQQLEKTVKEEITA